MIGYVTLGTNDLEKSIAFYDGLMKEFGAGRIMEFETFVAWGTSMEAPGLSVTKPFDGQAATSGNGTMVALAANSNDMVKRVYAKAMELEATCEGKPGDRGGDDMVFYAAYFRDPDGNKLNCFCTTGQ